MAVGVLIGPVRPTVEPPAVSRGRGGAVVLVRSTPRTRPCPRQWRNRDMIDKTYVHVADGDDPDRRIAPGDVAIDLAQSSPVIVLRREADSVTDYMDDHGDRMDRHLLDYPGNHLTGATEGDSVYRCVFVPNDVKSDEWRTYDYPETRLARVPAENADDTVYRVQHTATIRVMSHLIEAAADASVSADPEAVKELLGDAGIDPELIDAAEDHAFWGSPGDYSAGVRRVPDEL